MTDELSIRPKADLATADPAATRVLSKANALVLGAGLKADAQLRSDRPVISLLSLYPDGQHIVGLERYGTIVIWNLTSGKVVAELHNPDGIESIAACPAGPRIACCALNGGLWIADPAAFDVRIWETEGVFAAIAFSPDGRWLIAAGEESISLFSAGGDKTWSAPQIVQVWENSSLADDALFNLVAWAPDSRSFAAATWDGRFVVRGEVDKSSALTRLVLTEGGQVDDPGTDGLWFSRDGDLWRATDDGLTRWRARSVDYFDYEDLPGDLAAHLIGSYICEVSIGLERDGLFICAQKHPDETDDIPRQYCGLQGSVASGRFNRVSLGAAHVSAIAPTPEECCAVVSTIDGLNRLIRFDTGEALELAAPRSTSSHHATIWHDSNAALIITSDGISRVRAYRELDGSLCAEWDAGQFGMIWEVGHGTAIIDRDSAENGFKGLEIVDIRSGRTVCVPSSLYPYAVGAGIVVGESRSNFGTLETWSTITGALMSEIETPAPEIASNSSRIEQIFLYKDAVAVVGIEMAFSPDGDEPDDLYVLYRWAERTGVWQATEFPSYPPSAAWMGDSDFWQSGEWLAYPDLEGCSVELLNLAAPDLAARRVQVPREGDVNAIEMGAVSSDGCRLAVVAGAEILVIDVATGQVHWSCDTGNRVWLVSFSLSGQDLLWAETLDGQLRYKRQRL